MRRLLAVLGLAIPLFGQYGGPAILSRGEAPSAMSGPQLSFRPFVEVTGAYNTGLSGVTVDSQGNIANQKAIGVSIAGGISGSHSWRRTQIGLDYRGSYYDYPGRSNFNSSNQSLLLGIRYQPSRHTMFSLSNAFGVLNRDYGLLSTISPAVPFDPNQSYIPTTDFFNNRTIFGSSQANLIYQRSTRMSFSFGGGLFINRRGSSALYGVTGESALADMQYRLTKRLTVGGNYNYGHYSFTRSISNTNTQGASGTLAYQLSRTVEFSGYAGFARIETKFVQNVAVDPAVAAIIGITESSQIVYSVHYTPNASARLSKTFHKGVLYANGGHTVTPGNGLFLTSTMTIIGGGYTYTGLRKWSFGANTVYQSSTSIGNVIGTYGGVVATASVSRQIARSLHAVGGFSVHRYNSASFSHYNSVVYSGNLGLGWAPGAVPLRIW